MMPRLECCLPSSPKTNSRADVRVAQDAGDQVAQPAEERLARRDPQHEDGEQELQPEPPRDHPPADGAPVVRERDADREDEREPDQPGQPARARRRSAPAAGAGCGDLDLRAGHGRRRPRRGAERSSPPGSRRVPARAAAPWRRARARRGRGSATSRRDARAPSTRSGHDDRTTAHRHACSQRVVSRAMSRLHRVYMRRRRAGLSQRRQLLAHPLDHRLALGPRQERVGEAVEDAAVDLGPGEAELRCAPASTRRSASRRS